jgi:glycine cleavage system H protein
MIENYAILPCNGLDKCAGVVSREIALKLCENNHNEIICPVFARIADVKYHKLLDQYPLLIIDGCATRCASKLLWRKDLRSQENHRYRGG